MTYRATVNIYVGGVVLAYRPGDVVPASAVERLGAHDKVKRDDAPPASRAPRTRRAAKPKAKPADDAPQESPTEEPAATPES